MKDGTVVCQNTTCPRLECLQDINLTSTAISQARAFSVQEEVIDRMMKHIVFKL